MGNPFVMSAKPVFYRFKTTVFDVSDVDGATSKQRQMEFN